MKGPMGADILVVDDAIANINLMSEMLKSYGYRVRPALSAATALRAARQQPPDLVLLDVDMPDMDGFDACREFKAVPALRDIPIIFISALEDTRTKIAAFAKGGVDFITKPFQIEEVNARIKTHLELQRLSRSLQKQNLKLRELQTLRDNLTSMIIHDLRSPLTGITGYLDLLDLHCNEDEEARQFLSKARKASECAADMINSLLEITRLEQAQLPIRQKRCDLEQLIYQAVSQLESLIGDRGFKVHPEACVEVLCDPDLTARVITNLVHNAIEFTDAIGHIEIRAIETDNAMRVEVVDDGPGIEARHHEVIFGKFAQLQSRSDRRVGGLGLAFCKLAVEAQGGAIGVDSQPGQGSCFWFELPQAQDHGARHASPQRKQVTTP